MAEYTKKDFEDIESGILSYTSFKLKPKIVKPYYRAALYSIMVGDEEVVGNIPTLRLAKKSALRYARKDKATEILKVVAVVSWRDKLKKVI